MYTVQPKLHIIPLTIFKFKKKLICTVKPISKIHIFHIIEYRENDILCISLKELNNNSENSLRYTNFGRAKKNPKKLVQKNYIYGRNIYAVTI